MKWADIDTVEKIECIPDEAVFAYIEKHTRLLSGPGMIKAHADEVIVICQLKNGMPYLPAFLAHHRALGVKHFFFLDNGSQDQTLAFLQDQQDVSLFQSLLPFKVFRIVFKRYLIQRIAGKQWVLLLDIDEFFDYPFSDSIALTQMLAYLSKHHYSAVLTQMLDLFGKEKLGNAAEDFRHAHRFYELSHLTKKPYTCPNQLNNPALAFFQGGIRSKAFELDLAYLTKHALFWADEGIRLDHDHWVSGAVVADFSAVLYHYKFLPHFLDYVRDAVEKGYHYAGSQEYVAYLSQLERKEPLVLWSEESRELLHVNQLIADHFLVVSTPFLQFIQTHIDKLEQEKGDAFREQLIAIAGNPQAPCFPERPDWLWAREQAISNSHLKAYQQAADELEELKESFDWRLTRPLRWMRKKLNRS